MADLPKTTAGIPEDLGLLQCSFCGAERSATVPLFQGPGLSICPECTCVVVNHFIGTGAITCNCQLPDLSRPPNEEL